MHSPPSTRGGCGLEHSALLQLPAQLLHGDGLRRGCVLLMVMKEGVASVPDCAGGACSGVEDAEM